MILNNVMHMQNQIIHSRANSSARQSLLILPTSAREKSDNIKAASKDSQVTNFNTNMQRVDQTKSAKSSLLDMPRQVEDVSFVNMKSQGSKQDRLSTINQQSEIGSEDYVSSLNRASEISALTGFASAHPQGQTQQLQVKKSPFTMINEVRNKLQVQLSLLQHQDQTRENARYVTMQDQEYNERHSTADFGDISQGIIEKTNNPFGSSERISEI